MKSEKTPSANPSTTLYLVDISSFIFRAFFAIRNLKNKKGEPTNAVYGVATMLAKLAEEAQPEYMAVIYDSREPSFRKEIYPAYKANRSAPPDDLVPQFSRIEELIKGFEIHSYRQSGIEADDLIATLTQRWCAASPEHQVVIVSGDKDLMQLVNNRVLVWDTMTNKKYRSEEVLEKFGVYPEQIRDYLSIVGDSSDNIPGVPGIGPKGAVDLLKQYQTLEAILERAQAKEIPGKKGETLTTNADLARLSQRLATVRKDLKVDIPLESLSYHFHLTPECEKLFEELDFHTLLKRWLPQKASSPVKSDETSTEPTKQGEKPEGPDLSPDSRFITVNTEEAFQTLLKKIDSTRRFGFDLETTSLNPREAEIVGIAICCESSKSYYIPVGHTQRILSSPGQTQLPKDEVLERLRPYIEDPKFGKIGQNLKYDWSVLREKGFHPNGIEADTMIAAYLLDANGRYNLQALASKYLNYSVLTYEDVCGKGKDQLSFDQISIEHATRYSAEDAWIAFLLWEKLKPLLEKEGLVKVFEEIDLPLVDILSKMELQGVCIDSDWLSQLSQEFSAQLAAIEERIQAFTQGPINLNSPKQISQLLFVDLKLPTQGKTKTGLSTDARVLEILSPLHEVPRLLLEYREISKLKGTYVDPFPQMRDPKTGKIHASFHQTVAATGRLSSSDPNLQNIPIRTDRGMKIRRAFLPSPGNQLVSADYSQIELRILAHMSGDPELIRSFRAEEDVHRRTASEIFEVDANEVTDRQRGIAKAINFGLMYGKTVFGLSQELKIPRSQAQEIIQRYFIRYEKVKTFLDKLVSDAKENGYVLTLSGRKRFLPDIRSKNHAIRSNAERMAMNTPMQGTAADLMKLAMISIEKFLEKERLKSKLIIQVHDEVVLDCPPDEVDRVKEGIAQCMCSAIELSVPLRVNTSSGSNWMEL